MAYNEERLYKEGPINPVIRSRTVIIRHTCPRTYDNIFHDTDHFIVVTFPLCCGFSTQ
jgi:hypothetical protein